MKHDVKKLTLQQGSPKSHTLAMNLGSPPRSSRFVRPLALLLLMCLTPTVMGDALFSAGVPEWRWGDEPAHSSVEAVGGFIALLLAGLLMAAWRDRRQSGRRVWAASGLACMGLLDLSHACAPPGESFGWFHSLATCVGGVMFALTWVPVRVTRSPHIWIVFPLSLIPVLTICVAAWVFSGEAPVMIGDAALSEMSQELTLVGCLGFTAAAVWFFRRRRTDGDWEDRAFALMCLLFAAAGLMYELSAKWDAAWGGWHFARIAAYCLALYLSAQTYNDMSRSLQHETKTREEVEDSIKQSEERFRLLIDGIKDYAVFQLDPEGRVLTWNTGAERLKGYHALEIIGQHFSKFYLPEDVADGKPERELRLAAAEGRYEEEGLRVRKDGSQFWACVIITALRDEDGRLRGFAKITRDVTQHKMAEQRLRVSEQRIRLAIEATQIGIWEWNPVTNRIQWDEQMFRLYGMAPTPDGCLDYEDWRTAVLPEDLPQQEALLQAMIRQKKDLGFRQFSIRRRGDGAVRVIEAVDAVRLDENGEVESVVGTNWDVTERKEAEQLQRELDETTRLNRLMQGRESQVVALKQWINDLDAERGHAPSFPEVTADVPAVLAEPPVPVLDFETLIDTALWQSVMDAFCDVMGISAAIVDVQGKLIIVSRWRAICSKFHRSHPESQRNCVESDTNLARELAAQTGFAMYTCKNGLTDAAAPIVINDRHVANAFVGQFLTAEPDRKSFVEQARKYGFNEKEYLKALEDVPVLSQVQIDVSLQFIRGYAELLATLAMDTGRRRIAEDALRMQRLHLLSLAEDATKSEERAKAHAAQLSVANAELAAAKAAVEKVAVDLKRSNRELDDFAYIASHDLKEPLRGIHNYASFLLEDYAEKLDEDGRAKLETLPRLSQRLESFIEALLQFSRLGRTELAVAPTDLNELIAEVLDSLRITLEEGDIDVRIVDRLPTVTCDRLRMSEVFHNLITNAVKYNDKPEKWIEIGMTDGDDLDRPDDRDDAAPVFYVRDNGIGIQEKHIDRIFRIFKRLHGRDKYGGGTGAGLTIVKKIIEHHGGRIWAESAPGEGTTFYFTLQEACLDEHHDRNEYATSASRRG